MQPFHLAFPVTDINTTRDYYVGVLGCGVGRESERWIDFDFFGHQITAHLVDAASGDPTNAVDGKQVPVRHFGVVMDWEQWHEWTRRLRSAGVDFLIEPTLRFAGEVGEQATCFVTDPSGNAMEFKSFKNADQLFAREEAES